VTGGARLSGERADALVQLNWAEHERRLTSGLGALTDLTLLRLCMDLPLDAAVRWRDLPHEAAAVLRRARHGVVECTDEAVTRRVSGVGTGWTALLNRAAAFAGVAQRVIVLKRVPRDLSQRLWEAQVQGVGVWIDDGGPVVEVLPPEVFVPRLIKPARWRFQENAYASWLRSTGQTALTGAPRGHQAPPAVAASGRLSHPLPLG
jgi:hypothetical protein